MTLSSDQLAGHGLDAMLIVYSLLDNHPASAACESFNCSTTNASIGKSVKRKLSESQITRKMLL